jgi:hypothetical protein
VAGAVAAPVTQAEEEPAIASTAPAPGAQPVAGAVAAPVVEPAAEPAAEPEDAGPGSAAPASGRDAEPEPRREAGPEPAVAPDESRDGAVVHELRPRWRRLTWAVPVAAAAAAVFTIAVIGVQQALEPDAPVGVTYSAAGTPLAPDATGKVTVAKAAAGFSVVVDVKDLPAAAPGSYYIAWLRGPNGVVPLGSFHARQIAKPITLWSGVDPKLYPKFSVTLQREGAPPTPSGVTVLRGELTNP